MIIFRGRRLTSAEAIFCFSRWFPKCEASLKSLPASAAACSTWRMASCPCLLGTVPVYAFCLSVIITRAFFSPPFWTAYCMVTVLIPKLVAPRQWLRPPVLR